MAIRMESIRSKVPSMRISSLEGSSAFSDFRGLTIGVIYRTTYSIIHSYRVKASPKAINHMSPLPLKQGLYDPRFEKDACGVGFVVDIQGRKSHKIVSDALTVLDN